MTAEPSSINSWLESAPADGPSIGEFDGSGGAKLGFTGYRSLNPDSRTALVYLHGIESHAGWFDAPARLLQQRGYAVFCLDRRGSGINRENRGFRSGDVSSFETLLEDIHTFRENLRGRFDRVYLVGLSWGGKLGTGYVLRYPGDFDGMILITPGLAAQVDVSFLAKVGIFFALLAAPTTNFKLPIEPEMFTTTQKFVDFIRGDPLRLHRATARFLYESRKLDRFIAGHITQNTTPMQLFLASEDRIIDNTGVVDVLGRGAQAELEVHAYDGLQHSLQFECPNRLVEDMSAWIERRNDQ